ncbi:MAG TPA: PAS domain-containing sensor histidine kinase [Ramlibacter sp.]
MDAGPGPAPDARSAIEDAPCGLLQADEDGFILWANRTFCRWTGYAPHELAGKRFQDLLTMGGRIFHQTHLSPLLLMQGSVSEVKVELVQRDGQPLPVMVNAFMRDRDGRRLQEFAVYVARDRDKYEHELVLSQRKLEGALAEMGRLQGESKDRAHFAEQMVGIVSHDLRNPLSVIHMSLMLLERTGSTQQQKPVLARIERAAERASRLIAELLDFTQARLGGGIAVQPEPLQLHAFIHDTVDELRHAFPQRMLRHERAGGETGCFADADRLAQVVGNLVGNAMAYGSPGQPVTVTSRTGAAACEIAVHNFGPPIPDEHAASIFLPMERGERADKGGRSVGLGLYIVSEIAKAHGGRVTVRSNEAMGTEFTVTLPRAPASA